MKDHIYRPRRLPSTFGPSCLAERETTGRRRFCYGHEPTGQTLAMVVQHSGIEFDPARYLADPRRLCSGEAWHEPSRPSTSADSFPEPK